MNEKDIDGEVGSEHAQHCLGAGPHGHFLM